ncbi:DNA alkylation repair protein [Taibaiella sp. KBW10]|uniref:DNA alkylation repair protein n=1 Tax=Taibaiella sp. KBW10 TaxID=2153357 RepID=UPI0018F67722|nr:DNA alkylation repair protein [Taibaiella sp. KBW10]
MLNHVLQQFDRSEYLPFVLAQINNLEKKTVNETIGTSLSGLALAHKDTQLIPYLSVHPADLARCWATYTIGRNEALSTGEKLAQIKIFAADEHFGVREIAWMAVRPHITRHLTESIGILHQWTASPDDNIRRFASEATRPRGVWCAHIEALKEHPEQAISILEPLHTDPAKYVQDSVGNWLNDASKTQPQFVRDLCAAWAQKSNTKQTLNIIKRAMRTIEK